MPLVSARRLRWDPFQYIVEGTCEGTIIEGDVVDNETGDLVAGAGVDGEVHSEIITVNVQADENGHFRVVLPPGENHDYVFNISAPGYDPRIVSGSIKSGERKYLCIPLQYNPFELSLSDNTGSLTRGYAAITYSGRRSEPFLAQRTVPVTDADGNQVYEVVEEKALTGYTWEEGVTEYRTETASLSAGAGDWADTGETYELWPSMSLPSLSPGYRWVNTGSGWISSFYKKQYNAVEYHAGQGYLLSANYETRYRTETYQEWVSGYYQSYQTLERIGTETYQEWVSGYYVTRTSTYTIWSWEAVGGHWEWRWAWFMPYPVWVTDYGWVASTYTSTYQEYIPGYYVTGTRDVYGYVSHQCWIEGYYQTRTREVAYQAVASYTASRHVAYAVWEVRSSTTPDFYADAASRTLRDGVRNPKVVYTTTTRQVPRTRVEAYTAYRIYSYSGTGYTFLPWQSGQVGVSVVPKNGYVGVAELEVSVDSGVGASFDSTRLSLASEAAATLSLVPEHASSHVVVVKGHDANGRLVASRSYALDLAESLPSDSYSETLVETTENQPSIGPPRIETTIMSQSVQSLSPFVFPVVPTGMGLSGVYDDGSSGGAITRSFAYRVNPSTGERVYWTAWANNSEMANWPTPSQYDAQHGGQIRLLVPPDL